VENTIKNESDIVQELTQENLALKEEIIRLQNKIIELQDMIIKLEGKIIKLPKEKRTPQPKVKMKESYAERIKRIRAETQHNKTSMGK
jgi:hypothetical protein